MYPNHSYAEGFLKFLLVVLVVVIVLGIATQLGHLPNPWYFFKR